MDREKLDKLKANTESVDKSIKRIVRFIILLGIVVAEGIFMLLYSYASRTNSSIRIGTLLIFVIIGTSIAVWQIKRIINLTRRNNKIKEFISEQ